jgi:hypothetical protein
MSIKKEKTRKRRRPYKLIVKQLSRQGIKAKVVKRIAIN